MAFEHRIAFHAPFLQLPTATDRAVSLGAPDGPSNWQVFLDTLAQVTIPGLARHGLEAERAWNQATATAVAA